jgi:hypothetical protein
MIFNLKILPSIRLNIIAPFRFFNNIYVITYSGVNSITAGTYGSATTVAQITINDFGVTTALSNVSIAINANQVVTGTLNGLGFTNGTINSSTIGSVTPETGTFTTVTASKYVGISGGEF